MTTVSIKHGVTLQTKQIVRSIFNHEYVVADGNNIWSSMM